MQIVISKRYMKLPVTRHNVSKNVRFYEGEKLILDFDCHLDPAAPQQYYYWDMREHLGKTYDMKIVPEICFEPEFVDEVPMEGVYGEKYRPVSHFSASRGWINDPNGMCFYEGKYHMFFQHNPAGPMWGNMTWGHAISEDMVHWEQLEHALLPDEMGTMFSGSAIEDIRNVTGLKTGEHNPLLLFYTAAGNNSELSRNVKFTQCMAYSLDGGATFRKYDRNPVISHIIGGNRDPKVIYVSEEDRYYMALYLDGDEYALFASDDLLHWKEQQRLRLPGDAECPDFYPLCSSQGNRYWIFTGASDVYLVGRIENGLFVPVQEPRRLQYRGKAYAAQSFQGEKEYDRLRFSWNQSEIPESLCNGSMCTPVRMMLDEGKDGLWLRCFPMEQISQLRDHVRNGACVELGAGQRLELELTGKSQEISVRFLPQKKTDVVMNLLGLEIRVNPRREKLYVNGIAMPAFPENGRYEVQIITDVHSVEIYSGRGKSFTCVDHLADFSMNRFVLESRGGAMRIRSWMCAELKNIWKA